GKAIELPVTVELRQPYAYVEEPTVTVTRDMSDVRQLDVTAKSTKEFSGPPSVLELAFPPQPNIRSEALRGGTYRRSITTGEQTLNLKAKPLPLADTADQHVLFYVNVDGFARAFIYRPDFSRSADRGVLDLVRRPAVRVLPVGADRPVLIISAKPAEKTPVRIEVDNAPVGSKVAIRLDRSGTGVFSGADEVKVLESSREEHVYVDPEGPDG